MERIHIVGAGPRTGTTLLAECMVACFEIDAYDAHETSLCRHRDNVDIYLTKNPTDLNIVTPRLLIDKHLHVIAMLRDPRDVVVSTHRRNIRRYWTPLRIWKRHAALMRKLVNHRRFVLVRYETLVQEPDAVQDMLGSRMQFLKMKTRFSEFQVVAAPSTDALNALGSLRPIGADSIGSWRNHLPRLAGQLLIHGPISRELIEFGYEEDDHWLRMLDGVKPDLSSSHLPENILLPLWKFRRRKYTEALTIAGARLLGLPLV